MDHLSVEVKDSLNKSDDLVSDAGVSSGADEESPTLEIFLFQFIGEARIPFALFTCRFSKLMHWIGVNCRNGCSIHWHWLNLMSKKLVLSSSRFHLYRLFGFGFSRI